jgi:ATP-dependent protease Clp ATPase subunit
MYEIPSRKDVTKIIVTPEVIRKEVNPLTISEGEEKSA